MRNPAAVELKGPAWAAGYVLLGIIGSIALIIPLYGYLAYWASLLYPLLIGWPVLGLVVALGRGSRWSRLYLFGNVGVLASTFIAFTASWIFLALSATQPDTAVTAPLYLALVLFGLAVGIVVGARQPGSRHSQP